MTDPATHPRLAGLLAAVLADPEEDAPRLVYADWLQEHGDGADALRGEFIRVQVELAWREAAHLPPGDPCTCTRTDEDFRRYRQGTHCAACRRRNGPIGALRRRERDLLLEHGTGWLAAAFPWVYSEFVIPNTPKELGENRLGRGAGPVHLLVEFRRGFVGSVTCTAATWPANASAILAAQPIVKVAFADHGVNIERKAGLTAKQFLDVSREFARFIGSDEFRQQLRDRMVATLAGDDLAEHVLRRLATPDARPFGSVVLPPAAFARPETPDP